MDGSKMHCEKLGQKYAKEMLLSPSWKLYKHNF